MSAKNDFVSEIDQFLQKFDRHHPELSRAQQQEKTKYDHIYYLRDTANRPDEEPVIDIWA